MRAALRVCVAMIAVASMQISLSTPAHAQTPPAFPAKPVRLLIGLPPGGGSDPLARGIAQRLAVIWGQPVIVENRPGANTSLATELVARAAPDGHTLLFAIDIGLTVNPHLYSKLGYDPIRDFTPITLVNTFATLLIARPGLAANSIAELVELARRDPGKITYSSIGAGSQMHLLSEMFAAKAEVKFLHVPYKGIAQMVTAVLAGEVDFTWAGVYSARPQVSAGKLKAIGYGSTRRTQYFPDLPTFAEAGYPDVEMPVWYGIMGPAGMPRALAQKIHEDIAAVIADPEFRNREIVGRGYEASGLGLDDFAAHIKSELARRGEMVRISGAKVD